MDNTQLLNIEKEQVIIRAELREIKEGQATLLEMMVELSEVSQEDSDRADRIFRGIQPAEYELDFSAGWVRETINGIRKGNLQYNQPAQANHGAQRYTRS